MLDELTISFCGIGHEILLRNIEHLLKHDVPKCNQHSFHSDFIAKSGAPSTILVKKVVVPGLGVAERKLPILLTEWIAQPHFQHHSFLYKNAFYTTITRSCIMA
jgi:hypothetical protein